MTTFANYITKQFQSGDAACALRLAEVLVDEVKFKELNSVASLNVAMEVRFNEDSDMPDLVKTMRAFFARTILVHMPFKYAKHIHVNVEEVKDSDNISLRKRRAQ